MPVSELYGHDKLPWYILLGVWGSPGIVLLKAMVKFRCHTYVGLFRITDALD